MIKKIQKNLRVSFKVFLNSIRQLEVPLTQSTPPPFSMLPVMVPPPPLLRPPRYLDPLFWWSILFPVVLTFIHGVPSTRNESHAALLRSQRVTGNPDVVLTGRLYLTPLGPFMVGGGGGGVPMYTSNCLAEFQKALKLTLKSF